jgi:hypothetical protein
LITQTIIFTSKSKTVKDPFKFNMSGLDIKHDGMKWESDLVKVDTPKPKESPKMTSMFTML